MKFIFSYLILISLAFPLNAQDDVEHQINEIRKEFQKINSELNSYDKKTSYEEIVYLFQGIEGDSMVEYAPPVIEHSITYGYFNEKNELVLLTNEYFGEEQYWHNHQYYFKDGNIFFMFIGEGVHGEDQQERIYFHNNKIIRALIKKREYEENKEFKDIKNQNNNAVLNNIDEQSIKYLKKVQDLIDTFYEGLKE